MGLEFLVIRRVNWWIMQLFRMDIRLGDKWSFGISFKKRILVEIIWYLLIRKIMLIRLCLA
jgi:hypothetical protein